jgi:hypothetical protein
MHHASLAIEEKSKLVKNKNNLDDVYLYEYGMLASISSSKIPTTIIQSFITNAKQPSI